MYYYLQQGCLVLAIILANVIGLNWFDHQDLLVRVTLILLLTLTASIGVTIGIIRSRRKR